MCTHFTWMVLCETTSLSLEYLVLRKWLSFFFLFLFFFLASLWHMEFLGQGLDLNHNCDDNARSLTYCAGLGMEPAARCFRDWPNPIAPQWSSMNPILLPSSDPLHLVFKKISMLGWSCGTRRKCESPDFQYKLCFG